METCKTCPEKLKTFTLTSTPSRGLDHRGDTSATALLRCLQQQLHLSRAGAGRQAGRQALLCPRQPPLRRTLMPMRKLKLVPGEIENIPRHARAPIPPPYALCGGEFRHRRPQELQVSQRLGGEIELLQTRRGQLDGEEVERGGMALERFHLRRQKRTARQFRGGEEGGREEKGVRQGYNYIEAAQSLVIRNEKRKKKMHSRTLIGPHLKRVLSLYALTRSLIRRFSNTASTILS